MGATHGETFKGKGRAFDVPLGQPGERERKPRYFHHFYYDRLSKSVLVEGEYLGTPKISFLFGLGWGWSFECSNLSGFCLPTVLHRGKLPLWRTHLSLSPGWTVDASGKATLSWTWETCRYILYLRYLNCSGCTAQSPRYHQLANGHLDLGISKRILFLLDPILTSSLPHRSRVAEPPLVYSSSISLSFANPVFLAGRFAKTNSH